MRERWLYRLWMWHPFGRWVLPVLAVGLWSLAALVGGLESSARLSLVAVGVSLLYFDQRHRLEATRLLREISETCNERYDALWTRLQKSLSGTDQSEARVAFTKYLNLCAEEYLYHSQGLLPPVVWTSWSKGMKLIFLESAALREFAEDELSGGSYYGFNLGAVGIAMGIRNPGT